MASRIAFLDKILERKNGNGTSAPATASAPAVALQLTKKIAAIIDAIPCDEPASTMFDGATQDPHIAEGVQKTLQEAGLDIPDGTVQSTLYKLRNMKVIGSKPVEIIRDIAKTDKRAAHRRNKASFAYWQISPRGCQKSNSSMEALPGMTREREGPDSRTSYNAPGSGAETA